MSQSGKEDEGQARSVISINQSGGITAGTVNIQAGVPEPKVKAQELVANEPCDGGYKTEFLLTIETQVAVPNFFLQVNAPTIRSMETTPQRAGVADFGNTGTRKGLAFTNIQSAYGSYRVTVITNEPERFEVIYDY